MATPEEEALFRQAQISLCTDPDIFVRAKAVRKLKDTKLLLEILNCDDSAYVRVKAGEALWAMGPSVHVRYGS